MKANSITSRKWVTIKSLACTLVPTATADESDYVYDTHSTGASTPCTPCTPSTPSTPKLPVGTRCIIFIAVPVAKVNSQAEITRTCKSFTFDVTSVANNCCGIIWTDRKVLRSHP